MDLYGSIENEQEIRGAQVFSLLNDLIFFFC